ncbi:PREDICTED: uncharacterized protein LOC107348879 [Acropora digitifera]|uniref:uncharacterized protein LOC107348879 n=1 Tax=Acropora digitifera TaxID=70779 RepID=UPI00077A7DD8|nr:PREDICTED: uncharacterized protein LOC107348879 [Acropora digitifera]
MPNLKTLTKELRQEIVNYLYPLPSISSNLAFRLAIHIFTKTRFSSHINFISRCLQHKAIPKGFRSNFHASIFSNVSNFNLKYLHEIQRTQNTFSHNIMRSTIRAMCSKRNELNKQIIECRSQLSNVCPSVLLRSIHAKIQALNSKLFHHLEQTKKHKLENLTNSPKNRTEPLENQNHHTVVTIPENLPLSNAEKAVLSKGLNFVPISKKSDEFTTRQDVEKFLRRVQLKAFFHNKEDKSDNTEKDAFETLTAKKSKWTPPEGQFASIDYFIKKCRHDVHKLKSNCNTKLSNLSKEEWTALINLKNRKDRVIKPADKGGATVVWRTDLYQQEAIRQLSDPTFYTKVNKDLTPANQKIVKDTIQELIRKQELPVTAQNLIITTPRTSCIYFKPKIHKPNNPGRPIVSACSCPTELISSYLDKVMTPIVKSLPSYIKDSNHALETFGNFNFSGENKIIFTMDITSLYTVIPNNEGLQALKYFFNQRPIKKPSSETLLRLEFPNPHNNEEVIFNNMLRGRRNRFKAKWQVLNKCLDMASKSVSIIVYACFFLHDICEMKGVPIYDDIVVWQIAQDKLIQPNTEANRRYSFNSAEGTYVRNVITAMYKEHLPQ